MLLLVENRGRSVGRVLLLDELDPVDLLVRVDRCRATVLTHLGLAWLELLVLVGIPQGRCCRLGCGDFVSGVFVVMEHV